MQFDLKSWNHHCFFLPGKIQYIGESIPLRLACQRHRYCFARFILCYSDIIGSAEALPILCVRYTR